MIWHLLTLLILLLYTKVIQNANLVKMPIGQNDELQNCIFRQNQRQLSTPSARYVNAMSINFTTNPNVWITVLIQIISPKFFEKIFFYFLRFVQPLRYALIHT